MSIELDDGDCPRRVDQIGGVARAGAELAVDRECSQHVVQLFSCRAPQVLDQPILTTRRAHVITSLLSVGALGIGNVGN